MNLLNFNHISFFLIQNKVSNNKKIYSSDIRQILDLFLGLINFNNNLNRTLTVAIG